MPAATVAVEMAFGFGPNDASPTWTDISSYVDMSKSVVDAKSGRSAVRGSLSPGSLRFVLDNSDRRFDPSYTAGPYYGDLVPGVPVRVRTTYSATTRTRWSGFVNSGWGQPITSGLATVEVTAHDSVGQAAITPAPQSAWDVFANDLAVPPDQWWRPGADGWIDRVSGLPARHTSGLVEMDPVVDGGEKSWGQNDPDGYMETAAPAATINVASATDWHVVSGWFRLPSSEQADPIRVVSLASQSSGVNRGFNIFTGFRLEAMAGTLGGTYYPGVMAFELRTTTGYLALTSDSSASTVPFHDGRSHRFAVRFRRTSDPVSVWIDGLPFTMVSNGSGSPATAGSTTTFAVGGDAGATPGSPSAYSGVIDHVMVWENYPGTADDVEALELELLRVGRLAWSGDRMDQRLTKIVDGAGLGNTLGTLDTSGVVTTQGYRTGDTLTLLQAIENTEQGRIWADRDGKLRFAQRGWAWANTQSTTVQLTLSDVGSLLDANTAQYMVENGTVITNDPYKIVNVAQVTSAYGRMQTVEDAASIAKYGRRNPIHLSGLLHPSDRQSQAIAEWLVFANSEPMTRVEQVSFTVETNPAVLAPIAAQIEEGWLVRVIKAPPKNSAGADIGSNLDIYAHVIGVRHRWTGGPEGTWTVTLLLDSSRANRTWFRAGVSLVGGPDLIAF